MLILAATVLALLLVPALGGRLRRLADLRLQSRWVILYALSLQVLAISIVPDWPRPAVLGLHTSSYVLAGVFVWLNRSLPGLPLLAAGAGLNAFAIAMNGGQMPADAEALAQVGIHQEPGTYVNSGVVEDPRLDVLGDVFPSPSWLPLQNVYSVGDLLILLGAVWLVHRQCGTVLTRRPDLAALAARLPRPRRTPAPPPRDRTVVVPEQFRPRPGAATAQQVSDAARRPA